MMHMSRLSEEFCLWSSTEFGFIELDDAFATGSSMMPQKKNPDISELVRGKTGRVYGHLMAMLTTAKGLPLTYNKDLQEDKEGFFDAIDTLKFTLAVYSETVNYNFCFNYATDLADYLVRKGLPFRMAHEVVGKCVAYAITEGKFLPEISLDEYKKFSDLFEADLLDALKPENCVAARTSYGGPAFTENDKQFVRGDEIIAGQKAKVEELKQKL